MFIFGCLPSGVLFNLNFYFVNFNFVVTSVGAGAVFPLARSRRYALFFFFFIIIGCGSQWFGSISAELHESILLFSYKKQSHNRTRSSLFCEAAAIEINKIYGLLGILVRFFGH